MFLDIVINLMLAIHILVSLLMVLVVLMQRPKNEGLGAAFGGGMTDNLFGAQTTNVLQKFTVYLGSAFFALTLALAVLYAHKGGGRASSIESELTKADPNAPAASPTPNPAASSTSVEGAPAAASPAPAASPVPATEAAPTANVAPAPTPLTDTAATPASTPATESASSPAPATEAAPAAASPAPEASPANP